GLKLTAGHGRTPLAVGLTGRDCQRGGPGRRKSATPLVSNSELAASYSPVCALASPKQADPSPPRAFLPVSNPQTPYLFARFSKTHSSTAFALQPAFAVTGKAGRCGRPDPFGGLVQTRVQTEGCERRKHGRDWLLR